MGIVKRVERIETIGILLRRTVAAQQSAVEINAHLGHHGAIVSVMQRGQLDARNEVLASVGSQLSNGQLAPREDDRLCEIFQHKRQRRSRVGHGVGAVQNDKTIILCIARGDNINQLHPKGRRHIARIDGLRKLVNINLRRQQFYLGNVLQQMVEI